MKNAMMYYSVSNNKNYRNGVAMLESKSIANHVTDFIPLSSRVMMIKIKTNYWAFNIIQICTLTADKDENTFGEWYNEVGELLKTTKTKRK